jgi:hypothetical protein
VERRGGTRAVVRLGVAFAGCAGLALAAGGLGERIAGLYPGPLPPHPYFIPSHAALLYLFWPAVVVATLFVIVFPGICLALLRRPATSLAPLIVEAFALCMAVQILVHVLVSAWIPERSPRAVALLLIGTGTVCWLLLARRHQRRDMAWTAQDRRRLAWLVVLPVLAATILLPVLSWQDFNPDGLEAFTTGRSLFSHALPLMPNGRAAGIGLGMLTEAFPVHWFIALVGPVEAAARLPVILVLPVLFAGLVALAELGASRRLGTGEEATLALGLAAVIVTIVYNASYHVYSADMASPGAIDLLAATFLVGATLAWFTRDGPGFTVCTLLGFFTRPTMLLWLVLLGLGWLIAAPREWRRLAWIAAGFLGCLAAGAVFERIVGPLAGLSFEQDSGALGHRLRFLRFTDLQRFAFLVVPSGFLPALALLAWRRQDASARALSVASVGYFAFFYVIAFTAPHHFIPAMLIPLAVLWRVALARSPSRSLMAAAAAGGLVGLVLSLPRTLAVDRSMRAIGAGTDYRIGEYEAGFAGYREAFEGRRVLDSLFPTWQTGSDPAHERIGHAWVQVHYARRGAPTGGPANYVVLPAAEPPPADLTRLAADTIAALYVRDRQLWQRDRRSPPRTDFRSPVYDLPRTTLLEAWGAPAGAYDVDLRALLNRLLGRQGGTGPDRR